MNQCKHCGKEIPEGRKFCNSSCAAKYNNVHRIRKPWTEEQKQKIRYERVEQICKYCGQKTGLYVRNKHRKEGVCIECKPFTQRVRTFTKLNIEGISLKEKNNNLVNKLYSLYFEEKLSLSDIQKQTGLRSRQVEIFLSEYPLRSRGEGIHEAWVKGKEIPGLFKRCRHGWYTTWEGKRIFYRSSYELEYALQLDEQQISYDVEDLRIEYFDTQRNEKRVAIPDFHLLDTNEIVEIKSTYTFDEQLMKDKFKAYKALGYLPKLILDKKEYKITTI